jgi:superfamily I DNA/RNA helicase
MGSCPKGYIMTNFVSKYPNKGLNIEELSEEHKHQLEISNISENTHIKGKIQNKQPTFELSKAQTVAVAAPLPTIVLSAAGTGKTAVIIRRIVKAKEIDQLSLDSIFATTFTRKAAHEMTQRIQKLISAAPKYMGTFHRNSILLVKKYPILVEMHGYNHSTQLIDATDRDRILSHLLSLHADTLKQLQIPKTNAKKWMREGIDSLKGRGLYPIDYANAPA